MDEWRQFGQLASRSTEQGSVSLRRTLAGIAVETKALGFKMASEPAVGAFLRSLVASRPKGVILELGTGTGLSTAWMLDGLSKGGQLVSVDSDSAVQGVARRHLESDPRISFSCMDGSDFICAVAPGQFDLIFADAWPGKYSQLEEALALLKPGGIYIVDDLLPQPNWPDGHQESVNYFIAAMKAREDFAVALMDWASGLLVATKLV
ncbi:MAG: class I SAM-dependent methyltransferase [Alphaproteobacteria bacterium]|nr:class I SAM-dependent methyltransferase [Alphaproteobacteria bacterium]